MSDYRRALVPGGCFFFTVVTHDRQRLFDEDQNVDRLREGFRRTMEKHPFQIDAIVILPDHLHTLWRLHDGDANYSLRWRLIKHYLASGVSAATNRRGEKQVWQRRFWEHAIRDEGDWRWSSFEKGVGQGWYLPGWGESAPSNQHGIDFE